MKDLEFLEIVVRDWPEGAEAVRLDKDGEVCFEGGGCVDYDFYPENGADYYVPYGHMPVMGKPYSKEDWENERARHKRL